MRDCATCWIQGKAIDDHQVLEGSLGGQLVSICGFPQIVQRRVSETVLGRETVPRRY